MQSGSYTTLASHDLLRALEGNSDGSILSYPARAVVRFLFPRPFVAKVDTVRMPPAPTLQDALLPFQREGVAAAVERWDGRILLGDEMGLGKTIQVSD